MVTDTAPALPIVTSSPMVAPEEDSEMPTAIAPATETFDDEAPAMARVLVALQLMPFSFGIVMASLFWILAFLLFVMLYLPVLARPRVDGRPG